MRHPTAQLSANHRPAELIPPGVHPGQVVVIQAPGPSYAGRILLTIAISGGTALVIVVLAFAFQTAAAAAAAAVPTVGGASVSINLARKR
ncbi:hypothetical protein [Actinacidiphila bryophytorum]|uniref:Uncharacterized protein n=1 Tax=Actinacidiphila bryophytorum TaxID=1436133 RepID=A0A9W4E3M0_9ACTN|nr:hypothetical protein [Actinacidiphila bryophytorum]MBM9434448.1 hypothetical protein [Actinacidiphila bryophytorum]MBN6541922.1 hypothetical protein [Actinacidiphila bryophytorum]CAG7626215.1 conserved hypothetical protein [Actinacidiphila bryophytorum]